MGIFSTPDGSPVQPVGLTAIGRPIAVSSTGGAQANTVSIAAVPNFVGYVTGFAVTGLGATSVGVITVTLTGTGNTLNYTFPIPAGVTVAASSLVVNFTVPLQASAAATAITLTVPTFGAGNTNASAVLQGFYLPAAT